MADESKDGAFAIMELGHHRYRAGMAGESVPRHIDPPVLGRSGDDVLFGYHALTRDRVKCTRVLPRKLEGHYDDWDAMLRHTYSAMLHEDPTRIGCCLTIKNTPKVKDLDHMCQFLFEELDVPRVRLETEARLQMLSTGKTAGLVVDAGYAYTVVTPVLDGYALSHTVPQATVGGGAALMRLTKAAAEAKWGVRLDDKAVEVVLEEAGYCSVLAPSNGGPRRPPERAAMLSTLQLPDGHKVEVIDDVCMAPSEVLFGSKGGVGGHLVTATLKAVNGVHRPQQEQMWNNVQLVGGLSQLAGYKARVTSELNTDTRLMTRPTVYGHDDCSNATFLGASILCSLPGSSVEECFTKASYDEWGPSGYFRFCAPFSNC